MLGEGFPCACFSWSEIAPREAPVALLGWHYWCLRGSATSASRGVMRGAGSD
ncbi:hypothetical protein HMPREF1556_00697 [Porphyromonas sp. oral taxon 278 str. W7784]|nr:hypothetical protein HMPREF1556_00697 [Porphyromonas sp. oral taxon 278 str. W7784]